MLRSTLVLVAGNNVCRRPGSVSGLAGRGRARPRDAWNSFRWQKKNSAWVITWTMTAIGLLLLWKAVKRADTLLSGRALLGAIFLGWGLFNFFEGLIDHHILNLHHVVKRLGVSIYDYAFLAPGVIFVIASVLSIRGVPPDAVEVRRA